MDYGILSQQRYKIWWHNLIDNRKPGSIQSWNEYPEVSYDTGTLHHTISNDNDGLNSTDLDPCYLNDVISEQKQVIRQLKDGYVLFAQLLREGHDVKKIAEKMDAMAL